MNLFTMLLVLLFVSTVFSFVFQCAIQPVLRDSVRFRLFAERDNLRQMAINDEVDSRSFSFRHLEMMLNCMILSVDHFDARCYIESRGKSSPQNVEQAIEKFANEAPAELKGIEHRAFRWMTLALGYNTPFVLIVCLGIVAARRAAKTKAWVKKKQRFYWYGRSPVQLQTPIRMRTPSPQSP